MAKTIVEPVRWLLFSAGGMLAALLIPGLLVLFGVVFPLGWLDPPDHDHLLAVLRNPITRLVLLALCVLALFHWAQRFRYTLIDVLQLKEQSDIVNFLCYVVATAGSLVAAYLLLGAL
jgi:fumarate reductase subunit D